jgi:hypothetical protein
MVGMVLALGLTLVACGKTKSSGSTATTASAGTQATTGSGSETTTTAGGSAAAVKVCTVLPLSQVASLTGKQLTTDREQDAPGYSYQCDYFPNSGVGGVTITVLPTGGAASFQNARQVDEASQSVEHVTDVSGLGDKAFSARDGLRALFGDRLIYVTGVTDEAEAKAVILAVNAKL